MPRATTVVGTKLRETLYDMAARQGPREIYILADYPWDAEGTLHYLDFISDHVRHEDRGSHLDTIFDANGLRFKRERDV
jgi:hypothetical protein